MPSVAIDFGGTKIKIGVVDNGGLIAVTSCDANPRAGIRENLQTIVSFVNDFLNTNNIEKTTIDGWGIALPVILDSKENRVITDYVKYANAKQFDFNGWFKENLNLPVQLENDARAALVGEWQYGAGKGSNDLVMLTLGTGVGSAVLTNGDLLKGSHYLAGNMSGHTIINVDGVNCNCGSIGCLETEASTWALPQIAKRLHSSYDSPLKSKTDLSFGDLANAIDNDDLFAKDVFDHCIKVWGMCAANLVHSFDPEKLIVGGGIMKSATRILPVMQEYVDKHTWLPAGTVRVVAAQQSDYAALLGMDFLVNRRIEENRS